MVSIERLILIGFMVAATTFTEELPKIAIAGRVGYLIDKTMGLCRPCHTKPVFAHSCRNSFSILLPRQKMLRCYSWASSDGYQTA